MQVRALLVCLVLGVASCWAAYPPARYSRAWSLPPIYPPRTPLRPPSPYNAYYGTQDPYAEVVDFYYPLDPYDKYRLYQLPYYYPEPPLPYYGLEDDAPIEDDTILEEDRVPYGQETWYADRKDGNAEANAVFLQNLIIAQMYKDATAKNAFHYYPYYRRDDYDDGFVYGEPVVDPTVSAANREEEEVRELKSLVEESGVRHQPQLERSKHDNLFGDQRRSMATGRRDSSEALWYPNNEWRPDEKRSGPAKGSSPPSKLDKGQDEVVLPRPANPSRAHNYLRPAKSAAPQPTPRQPSVYDSIKKLLHMQDRLDQENESRPQKRSYIPSEESLVEQLDSLKKSA